MSQRETKGPVSLQQWEGVNQRLQPTIVPDGFFSDARGIFFGYGENAERLPGKVLAGLLATGILGIFVFSGKAIIQTVSDVQMTDVEELTNLALRMLPGIPGPVTFGAIGGSSVDVILPAFPFNTDSFSLQRSLDNVSFATVQTLIASGATVTDSTVSPSTLYYYRALAVNTDGSTSGPSASVTTIATFTRITELGDIRITEITDTRVTE